MTRHMTTLHRQRNDELDIIPANQQLDLIAARLADGSTRSFLAEHTDVARARRRPDPVASILELPQYFLLSPSAPDVLESVPMEYIDSSQFRSESTSVALSSAQVRELALAQAVDSSQAFHVNPYDNGVWRPGATTPSNRIMAFTWLPVLTRLDAAAKAHIQQHPWVRRWREPKFLLAHQSDATNDLSLFGVKLPDELWPLAIAYAQGNRRGTTPPRTYLHKGVSPSPHELEQLLLWTATSMADGDSGFADSLPESFRDPLELSPLLLPRPEVDDRPDW